ncbi:MAG: hypothetical protein IJW64_00145 [Clostridia bacterium]|nr:hypothetical protein [Clostridia bacterium]
MNEMQTKNFGFLSGNVLKIIACICMAIDHVGAILFPKIRMLRIIGRIAFPIFAFMIAEGCKYTKNRLRYFLTIFLLGVCFQIVYFIAENSLTMCIFITFSLSILIIYSLDALKERIINKKSTRSIFIAFAVFCIFVVGAYAICKTVSVDYGFLGVTVPVFASLFNFRKDELSNAVIKNQTVSRLLSVLCLLIGLIVMCLTKVKIQWYCLLAVPFLILYSGKRGRYNIKYFFYAFYPVHMVVIYGISILLNLLK